MAMVDAGLKAFSTDKPFVPEAVEWPGVEYSWAGDEHGRLTVTRAGRLPKLGSASSSSRRTAIPPSTSTTGSTRCGGAGGGGLGSLGAGTVPISL